MENDLEAIRVAITGEATPEARAAAVAACRAILATLEPPGAEPVSPSVQSAPTPQAEIAQIAAALRGVPADQLLELAVAHLRRMLPANTPLPVVQPVKFHLVPIPQLPGAKR